MAKMEETTATALANSVLVNIEVKNRTLLMNARRRGDVTIYRSRGNPEGSPARPNQVAWAATGLLSKQKIEIEAKANQSSQMRGALCAGKIITLTNANDLAYSGLPAGVELPMDGTVTWTYAVRLYDNDTLVPAPGGVIDPEVDIKDIA